jgi:hypothetical protein
MRQDRINNALNSSLNSKWYTFGDHIMAYTRHVTVKSKLDWLLFAKLLSKMQNLNRITWLFWGEPFPAAVKNLLQTSPNVKLWIEGMSVGDRSDDEDVQQGDVDLLKSLVGIPNARAAKVEINYEHPVTMRWLKDVLLSSCNLEILHLTLPRNQDGRIDWSCDGLGAYDFCV